MSQYFHRLLHLELEMSERKYRRYFPWSDILDCHCRELLVSC